MALLLGSAAGRVAVEIALSRLALAPAPAEQLLEPAGSAETMVRTMIVWGLLEWSHQQGRLVNRRLRVHPLAATKKQHSKIVKHSPSPIPPLYQQLEPVLFCQPL